MKKYLTAFIIAVTTCGGAHAIDISKCEKFGDDGVQGDWVVKCEMTDELREIQNRDENCMFQSVPVTIGAIMQYASDKDHFYINVVPGECGPDTTGYRMFKHQKRYGENDMYAICVCE